MQPFDWIVKHIEGEWDQVKRAPITIFLASLLLSLVWAYGMKWFYAERIEVLTIQYEQRSRYYQMSNSALSDEAFAYIERLQRFQGELNDTRPSIVLAEGATEEAIKQRTEDLTRYAKKLLEEFRQRFRAEGLLIRDTILKRLDSDPSCSEEGNRALEWGILPTWTNFGETDHVSDYIECLARSLPDAR